MCVPKTKAPAPVADTATPVYLHNSYLDSYGSGSRQTGGNNGPNAVGRGDLEIPLGIGFAGRQTSTAPSEGGGMAGTKRPLDASTLPVRPYQPAPNGAYTGPTDNQGNPVIPPTPIGPPDPGAPQGGSTGVSPGTFPDPGPGYFIDPNDPFGVPFRIPGG